MTALTVSGRSSSRVHFAASIFFSCAILQPGDAVGHHGLVALETDLHVAEPGIGQRGQLFLGQQHRRGNEIAVQPDIGRVLHQFDQILARGRLAAREMDLQHADFGELAQNLLPFLGRQFAAAAVELDRVGAIGALQRAAVRQFGEHRERNAERLRRSNVAIPEPRARHWARRRLFCHRRECRS